MVLTNDDVVEITQVLNLYGHVLDGRLWNRLPDVFTEDAVFDMSLESFTELGGQVLSGRAVIRDTFERVRHALAHHTSNVYVFEHDGEARALCKFFMPDSKGRFRTGEYADLLVRTPAGWRIKHRAIRERRYFDADHEPWTLLPPESA